MIFRDVFNCHHLDAIVGLYEPEAALIGRACARSERYTRPSSDVIWYEAKVYDHPKVFTRPCKISMSLYRLPGEESQLRDFRWSRVCRRVEGDLLMPNRIATLACALLLALVVPAAGQAPAGNK